jgi:hypothetical protein
MKILAFLLLVAGAIALVYGGINYTRQRTVVEIGSFKATATEQRHVPLSPIAGGLAVIGGILLLVMPTKRLVS